MTKRDHNMASDEDMSLLRRKQQELTGQKKALDSLEKDCERQKRRRTNEREVLRENPEVAAKMRKREKTGRPAIEVEHPGIQEAIIDIVNYYSAADEKRSSETLRCATTPKEFTSQLNIRGFPISQSATYLRLLSRNSTTTEGKRHVNTVPVRLIRATNDHHRQHVDTYFCKAAISYLEDIASILGPSEVLFISQDDKARIPSGITAANKQAPILMHMEYRVWLPDHDWVVAEKYKLIPSVYGIMTIKDNCLNDRAVTYSGPTYITIISGKHSGSTALSHARDFDEMITHPDFIEYCCGPDRLLKPNLIFTVDGGPDENHRYDKVINSAIAHFIKYKLDTLFVATNAPARSAFNRVERRMAPLSRELSGVILPHDHFGTHLNDRGKTIDPELEKKNFQHAGEVLAKIWQNVVFDGYPTVAAYVSPEDSEINENILDPPDDAWRQRHIRQGHYFLQITKCTERNCCEPPRGSYFKIFPKFLPAPLCINQPGLTANINSDKSNRFASLLLRLRVEDSSLRNLHGELSFDASCPSVQALISARTCATCGVYFASIKCLRSHKRQCGRHPTLDDSRTVSHFIRGGNARPIRIAAQRQREEMAIWTSQLADEHVDWIDDVDIGDMHLVEGRMRRYQLCVLVPLWNVNHDGRILKTEYDYKC